MLDSSKQLVLEELPEITIFPDNKDTQGFYVIPNSPRLSRSKEPDFKPEINFVLYGTTNNNQFKATGGIITLSVTLQLTPAEMNRLEQALSRYLQQNCLAGTDQTTLKPTFYSPDWLAADVEVDLIPSLKLKTKASMSGSNQCTFNQNLNAERAQELQTAWENGLPEAAICYRVSLNSAPGQQSEQRYSTSSTHVRQNDDISELKHARFHSSNTHAHNISLVLKGKIKLNNEELEAQLNKINL